MRRFGRHHSDENAGRVGTAFIDHLDQRPVFNRLFGEMPDTDAVKILALDGGGIRGLISCMVAAEIEARTGRRVAELFDHVAGTSTGAILALGAALPGPDGRSKFPASKGVEIYEDHGQDIFGHRHLKERLHAANVFRAKYPSEGIEFVLHRYFEDVFLSELLTDVTVTSYAICRREVHLFSSVEAREHPDDDYRVWDVARAATAAPTFFEPHEVTSRTGQHSHVLVDGAVFANNPAMCAFAEVERKGLQRDIVLVSLGTGSSSRHVDWPHCKEWGAAQWARPMLEILIDGSGQSTDYQLHHMLGPERYHRFQVLLDHDAESMDDASPRNIARLMEHGERLIKAADRDLDEVCETLTRS
jgi:patatin-like phospholipase/acyl hydrolase